MATDILHSPMDFRTEICLKPDPTDSITELRFSPIADHLMASSWDRKLRIYAIPQSPGSPVDSDFQLDKDTNLVFEKEFPGPILSSDWSQDGNLVAAGTASGSPVLLDLRSDTAHVWANGHDAAIKSIRFIYSSSINGLIIATGSWDGTLKYWDPRQQDPIASLDCKGKVYSMDAKSGLLAVVTSINEVSIVDLKEPGRWDPVVHDFKREKQYRHVECMHDGKGFGLGSIEGRCTIRHLMKENESKNFSFRCHRHMHADSTAHLFGTASSRKEKEFLDVYAVNSVSFHPAHGTIATGSSDGSYAFWDGDSKSRLGQSVHVSLQGNKAGGKGEMPITATSFNRDGTLFAYAAGYDWSKGFSGSDMNRNDRIFVHSVGKSVC